ncbi:MAG: single-stranded DNA-binding protein [Dehalococcoidia bacterium]|nr:single-stranded DNA-binding protein [Dehalococcoidia bacterium]
MVGLNKMMVIGNLGTDPEMRYTPNGSAVTSFRMATTRGYTSQDGERHQDTEWFTIVAWNQLAELCNQYLAKGRKAYVEGRLHSRSWEGQNGKTGFVNEIVADRIIFLDRQQGGQAAESGGEPGQEPGGTVEADDLPF